MCFVTQVSCIYTVESVVGFEMPEYNASEADGVVEICVVILEPADLSLLPSDYLATFNLSLVDAAAQGIYNNHMLCSIHGFHAHLLCLLS